MQIITYKPQYEKDVIALWQRCNLTRPQNDPKKDIGRKLKVDPDLFLIGVETAKVVATAMGGYDGHRGTVYYLGVDPDYQKNGLGREIMAVLEKKLLERGCPKLNLLFRTDNGKVEKFYKKIGYSRDACIEMGKRLIPDKIDDGLRV
jgi:ribosomal protein S18 acetylase RimI-like enzyme